MGFRKYRLKANLTQQELADKINMSKAYISQLENGKRDPSIKVLLHLAAILNTCPCRLLNYPFECPEL